MNKIAFQQYILLIEKIPFLYVVKSTYTLIDLTISIIVLQYILWEQKNATQGVSARWPVVDLYYQPSPHVFLSLILSYVRFRVRSNWLPQRACACVPTSEGGQIGKKATENRLILYIHNVNKLNGQPKKANRNSMRLFNVYRSRVFMFHLLHISSKRNEYISFVGSLLLFFFCACCLCWSDDGHVLRQSMPTPHALTLIYTIIYIYIYMYVYMYGPL